MKADARSAPAWWRRLFNNGVGPRVIKRFGLLDKETARRTEERILLAMDMIRKIDAIILLNEPERSERLMALKETFDRASMSTVCDGKEIKWPVFRWRLNFPNILKALIERKQT